MQQLNQRWKRIRTGSWKKTSSKTRSQTEKDVLSPEDSRDPSPSRLPGKPLVQPRVDAALDVPENALNEIRQALPQVSASANSFFEFTPDLNAKLAKLAEEKAQEYDYLRNETASYEAGLGFEHSCTLSASDLEKQANQILQELRRDDVERYYNTEPKRTGYAGQEHPRFCGDHFLSNADIIEKTQVFKLIRAMPKGAHLHIHFNANLRPHVLLGIAKTMERMFIWSNIPLDTQEAYDRCRIQFSIMNDSAVMEKGAGDLFDPAYKGGTVMQFGQFLRKFPGGEDAADRWLQSKLVFHEEEAHNLLQTADGAWEKFNARTQMMKGLFNYEKAYREYTRLCLEDFVDDKIQYAEIRPNFMSSNQVWLNDGSRRIDNAGIMDLIINEYEKFQETHKGEVLKGLKVIYCTPRSFSEEQVHDALMQCFQFKMNIRFGRYIAGFDLVGEESKGKPLKAFRKPLLHFKALCKAADVDIPFLFHCGETLDVGTDTDGNLVDALLLGARRIGHGFALPRHPFVMNEMRHRNVCIEVCPISNEILGLTPRISGHAVYSLLANNVPCAVSTDNGTLFRSRLSHDFYQVLAGKKDMTLHGLRQLVEWSIEHSCMEPELRQKVFEDWKRKWEEFCKEIVAGKFTDGGKGTDSGEVKA